jgi:hypothetical protein
MSVDQQEEVIMNTFPQPIAYLVSDFESEYRNQMRLEVFSVAQFMKRFEQTPDDAWEMLLDVFEDGSSISDGELPIDQFVFTVDFEEFVRQAEAFVLDNPNLNLSPDIQANEE